MVYGDLLRSMARRNPDGMGIVFEDKSFTWTEVNQRVNRFGNALLSLGLAKGDKVAIFAQNSHRYAETYFALAKTGLVAVPINWRSAPAEAAHIINHSEAKAVLVDHKYLPIICSIVPELPCVQHVIRFDDDEANRDEMNVCDYETLLRQSTSNEPPVEVFPDDVRAFSYTSGTTGVPKGCIVTHRQMLASHANSLIEIPIPRDEPTLLAVPFFTGYGASRLLLALYNRSTLIIQGQFQPVEVFKAIERYRISHICLVPTMIISLCNSPDIENHDLSSLRLIGYGGSVIAPVVLKQAMRTFKCGFWQAFGGTEVGGLVAFLTPEDHLLDGSEAKEKRLLSCGREAQFAEIRFVDDKERDVAPYELGELIVKCDSLSSGYWKMPEKTAETFRNGWVFTGDVGYRDADGYIYIADRKKDMIVSGGMNIYPAEIETVLYTHPAVAQAAVIGVPDDHWGEAVKAVIELKKGAQATEQQIIEFCRGYLGSYKKPKSVDFVESLPVSSGGKVVKRELREQYWQGRERRV